MRRHLIALFAACLWAPAAQAQTGAERALGRIIADYEALDRERDPISASFEGDIAAARLLPDVSPEAEARRHATLLALQARLDRIDARR